MNSWIFFEQIRPLVTRALDENWKDSESAILWYEHGWLAFEHLPFEIEIIRELGWIKNYDILHSNTPITTRLKNKIENNSTWEGTFYQSKWVKINLSWVILVFHFMCVAANESELFCMAHLTNFERFLYSSNLSF